MITGFLVAYEKKRVVFLQSSYFEVSGGQNQEHLVNFAYKKMNYELSGFKCPKSRANTGTK
jgi:hypothetical protein